MAIINTDSFTGQFELALANGDGDRLSAYIDRYESYYIRKLLGVEMGNDFIDNMSDPTQEARYDAIELPFQVQHGSQNIESRGMADLLTALVYYHYVSETQTRHTQSGVGKVDVETGVIASPENAYRFAERVWNEAIYTWEAIQWYIKNTDDFDFSGDNFQGETLAPKWSAIL